MDIEMVWRRPVRLQRAPKAADQDFVVLSLDQPRLPKGPGVYVFARAFGNKYEPIYIGKADNLRDRITAHLKKNVPLMKALRDAKKGRRAVLIAEIVGRSGQQPKRVLKIVERSLIAEAVDMRYVLVNRQLTKTKFHSLTSLGSTPDRGPFGRTYHIPIS